MSGGAGVGKSYVIRTVVQAVTKVHLSRAGVDFDMPPVMVIAPYETCLKVNAPVELTINVNTADGLTHGARGILKAFEFAMEPMRHVATLWILFDEQRVGLVARAASMAQYRRQPSLDLAWTPITRHGGSFYVGPRKVIEVGRLQFPVVTCAARTIHRNQGSSMPQAVVGLDKLTAANAGLHYTAVSRLTNPKGLAFTVFNPQAIRTAPEVTAHYVHKRQTAPLQLNIGRPLLNDASGLSVMTLNCRSLHRNIGNLRNAVHHKIYNFSFLVATESWQASGDDDMQYSLGGYNPITLPSATATAGNGRPARGIVYYFHPSFALIEGSMRQHGTDVIDCFRVKHHTPLGPLTIIGIYNPPMQTGSTLLKCLTDALDGHGQEPTIVTGDFNINLLEAPLPQLLTLRAGPLINFMLERGFRQLQPYVSHSLGSLLDHVWSNLGVGLNVKY